MIQVMNVRTGAIAGTISSLKRVRGIAIVPELGRGFITNGGDDTISIMDLKTLQKIGTTKAGKNPDAIAFDAVTQRVFVMNGDSNDATARLTRPRDPSPASSGWVVSRVRCPRWQGQHIRQHRQQSENR